MAGAAVLVSAATAASRTPPPQLQGVYKRSITQADLQRAGSKGPATGPAVLRVGPSTFRVDLADKGWIAESYTAKGSTLVLGGYTDTSERKFCSDAKRAVYHWSVAGRTLTISKVSGDSGCRTRTAVLVGRWQRA
jgi:hypothetical protein